MSGSADIMELRPPSGLRSARSLVPGPLRPLHKTVVERARVSAEALLLTGSTVRKSRTEISDLDYLLVGVKIRTDDLSPQLDMHVVSSVALPERVREGDDFVHWSLRLGCVVFDSGVVSVSRDMVASDQLWPDVGRKKVQARKSLGIAAAVVASGDHDAALEQVRTALTLEARWRLLADGCLPLSRAELPGQLMEASYFDLADGLAATVFRTPSLPALERHVQAAYRLLDAPPAVAEDARVGAA